MISEVFLYFKEHEWRWVIGEGKQPDVVHLCSHRALSTPKEGNINSEPRIIWSFCTKEHGNQVDVRNVLFPGGAMSVDMLGCFYKDCCCCCCCLWLDAVFDSVIAMKPLKCSGVVAGALQWAGNLHTRLCCRIPVDCKLSCFTPWIKKENANRHDWWTIDPILQYFTPRFQDVPEVYMLHFHWKVVVPWKRWGSNEHSKRTGESVTETRFRFTFQHRQSTSHFVSRW